MNTLVIRSGALGDVILTTPVIARLKETDPSSDITVATFFPNVFRNNPNVNRVIAPTEIDHPEIYNNIYNLDNAYEMQPTTHIVKAYMHHVFGDEGEDWDLQQKLYFDRRSKASFASRGRYVVINPTQAGWANRTLPRRIWGQVCSALEAYELQPILVGSPKEEINVGAPSFWVNDIHAHAMLYNKAACFVSSDSALLHVAGTTEVPIVGVYTCVLPKYRLPFRRGELGWNTRVVMPDLGCVGCQQRRPAPVTTESCEREGDQVNLCVRSVLALDIARAVLQLCGSTQVKE